jgi:hypothetical protein
MNRYLKCVMAFMVLLPMLMLSSCVKQPSGALPSPSPTDWHSGVKTDYSGLTAYKPPEEKYTRLKDGAMPNLETSSQYGKLLPYIGQMMYGDDGYNDIRAYGLMTASGQLVTDPVYSDIYQGSYYDNGTSAGGDVPVYSLERISDKIDKEEPSNSIIFAVCAADGSWITPFDYSNVFYTDKVIMLVRSTEKNDIDVMDYSGKLLYNTKSLGCYNDIPASSAYNFMSGYGEGLIALALSDGRTVFIDALTGSETYTDYKKSYAFSDGFAAVMRNGLFGYIDKSFTMVIPPQYLSADYFNNGKSTVQYLDSSYAIIDSTGTILLKNQYYIGRWDSSIYSVSDADNNTVYYNSAIQKITVENKTINPLYDGWFYYPSDNGVTVFKGDEKHMLQGVTGVNSVSGNLAVVFKNDADKWQEGLMTLDGKFIIPLGDNQGISVVTSEKSGKTLAVVSTYGVKQTFKVYDDSGILLFSGTGYANFDAQYDLFEVNSDLSFGYADLSGNYIFRISLQQYVPD